MSDEAETITLPTVRLPVTPPARRRASGGAWRGVVLAGLIAMAVGAAGIGVSGYVRQPLRRSSVEIPPTLPAPRPERLDLMGLTGPRSPVAGRLTDLGAGLSVARLSGRWHVGKDVWRPALGARPPSVMRAGRAEYLLLPLPAALGRSATGQVAESVVRQAAGRLPGDAVGQPYVSQALTGRARGTVAAYRVTTPAGGWTLVVAAVAATAHGRPGVLLVSVPRSGKAALADLPTLLSSLRPLR